MIGRRIKQARQAAGLSQRALAGALNVRTEYFFRPETVELKETEYRKHARLPKKVLARVEGSVIEQVERLLELERIMPSTPISTFDLPNRIPQPVTDLEDLEDAAVELREHWNLGLNPIPDLTDTLEEHVIVVLQTAEHGQHRFDGLVAMVDEERAANRFAGALLAPKPVVLRELGNRRRRLEPRELWILKGIYGLSMGGWLHRANDLGILPDVHYRAMLKHFRARGWHTKEPWTQYPQEQPKLFHQLVYRALAEDLISESKAAELLGSTLREFRKARDAEDAAGDAGR